MRAVMWNVPAAPAGAVAPTCAVKRRTGFAVHGMRRPRRNITPEIRTRPETVVPSERARSRREYRTRSLSELSLWIELLLARKRPPVSGTSLRPMAV